MGFARDVTGGSHRITIDGQDADTNKVTLIVKKINECTRYIYQQKKQVVQQRSRAKTSKRTGSLRDGLA
jgi:hypothetical protein